MKELRHVWEWLDRHLWPTRRERRAGPITAQQATELAQRECERMGLPWSEPVGAIRRGRKYVVISPMYRIGLFVAYDYESFEVDRFTREVRHEHRHTR